MNSGAAQSGTSQPLIYSPPHSRLYTVCDTPLPHALFTPIFLNAVTLSHAHAGPRQAACSFSFVKMNLENVFL